MPGTIRTLKNGSIATVILDNPEKLNAVDYSMWQSLKQVMSGLDEDDALRCIVIRGQGEQAFAAGGDLAEFLTRRATMEQAKHYHRDVVASALDAIDQCRHPTIAQIHGACIGGGLEIAAQCDLRICSSNARFGIPIGRLGFSIFPDELADLLHLISPAVALEMLLEGRIYDAEEAYIKGLVNRVVADDKLEEEITTCARHIIRGAPLVARTHKHLVRRLVRNPLPLSEQELEDCLAFLHSEDYKIGLRAFLDKTRPEFVGR